MALLTIPKLWNQLRYQSTDEQVKKMWPIYTMEFYSAIMKNEIISSVGKWMEMESTMLSEIGQTQKDKYSIFFLM
jgi:hypothetical protein